MNLFELISIIITVTALISYINHKFIKLPNTIGVMVISLTLAFILVETGKLGLNFQDYIKSIFSNVNLNQTLIQGLLGFILFSGAMHINWKELSRNKAIIISLATVGVAVSAFVYGTGIYYLFKLWGLSLSYIYCLLFGAILSPTDPVAVLSVLKTLKVPKHLEVEISGESLFNDGIGIVLFTILLEMAYGSRDITLGYVSLFFIEEALGGVAFGVVLAWIVRELMCTVDSYQVEILLSLALVMGCYAVAEGFHISAPIAVSSAGVVIGSNQQEFVRSQQERNYLTGFWEVVDWITLTILFVIIGMEILVVSVSFSLFVAGLAAVLMLLTARWVSVVLITSVLKLWRTFIPHFNKILTWSGLRGGIPVALALSLPEGRQRELIISITYVIVIFSIIVQGLTMKTVIKKFIPEPGKDTAEL